TTSDAIIVREMRIAARPETVFGFFTDPVKMMQWKGIDVMLDPRPGGIYRANITGKEIVRGEYLEVSPFTRIVFTWGWEEGPLPPGASPVEVTFKPDGDGTLLRLAHTGLTQEGAQAPAVGWAHFLPRLAIAAVGGDPGPDPWA